MAFVWSPHGANCCGISHISGFYRSTLTEFDACLRQHDTDPGHGATGNRLLEAVLTDRQLVENHNIHQSITALGGWGNVLAARGFVLKTGFRNSNTGRNVYVFHRVTTPIDLGTLPFTMDADRARLVPPVEEVIAAARPDLRVTFEGDLPAAFPPRHEIPVGTRVVCVLPSQNGGLNRGDICEIVGGWNGGTVEVRVLRTGDRNRYWSHRFGPLQFPQEAAPPEGPVELPGAAAMEAAVNRFANGARVVDTPSGRVGIVEGRNATGLRLYRVRMEDSNRTRLIAEVNLQPARPQERVVNPRPVPVEEPAARDRGGQVVRTQYRSVFRDGRLGMLRDSADACRETNPRCNRIDRVETLDNGDERITTL